MKNPQEQSVQWTSLLDALEDFDRSAVPVGLYAASEYQMGDESHPRNAVEWNSVLRPQMARLGFSPVLRRYASNLQRGNFSFVSRSGAEGTLHFIRTSKIKVRKYGNSFRVDPHHNFSERWAETGMAAVMRSVLRFRSSTGLRPCFSAILLVGFAAEENPFENELEDLAKTTGWNKMPLSFFKRSWPDPHGRSFNTLAALWVFEAGQPSAKD